MDSLREQEKREERASGRLERRDASVQIESWRREKSGLEKSYGQAAEAFRECNTRFTALQSAVSTLREQNKEAELLSEPEILACKAVLSEKKKKPHSGASCMRKWRITAVFLMQFRGRKRRWQLRNRSMCG